MRLLNVYTHEFPEFPDERHAPQYIIASHRWTNDEISYQQFILRGEFSDVCARAGYGKIKRFCRFVRQCRTDQGRRLKWLWIDTICINKSDFSELHEAINCMFRWYQSAYACVAYLHDVPMYTAKQYYVECSEWFRRGWTLQELCGPKFVFFVDRDWNPIGYKGPLTQKTLRYQHREPFADRSNEYETLGPNLNLWVARATAIPGHVLLDYSTADSISIADKRAWMANRRCTRAEDETYCLLGMCGVYLSLIYGERERAAIRLNEEILKQSRSQQDCSKEESTTPETVDSTNNIIGERIARPYGMSCLAHSQSATDEVVDECKGTSTRYQSQDRPHGPTETPSDPPLQSNKASKSVNDFTAEIGGTRLYFATSTGPPDFAKDMLGKRFKDFPKMHVAGSGENRGRRRAQMSSESQQRSSPTMPAVTYDTHYRYFDEYGRHTSPDSHQDISSSESSSRSSSPAFPHAGRVSGNEPVNRERHVDAEKRRQNARFIFGLAAVGSLLLAAKDTVKVTRPQR